jgi:phosphoglycerate dehydrogenase-like enzyme
MRSKVVISETLDDKCAQWLGKRAEVMWASYQDESAFAAALAEAQGLVVRTYTQVNDALLDLAPNVRVVGRAGVGLDNIDLDACRARGVQVVYTPDANSQAVVEYVFALMLDAFRPRGAMPDHADAHTFHQLRKTEIGRQLDQMTLGIVGFGRIGRRVGQVAHAIGMNLKVCDLLPETELRKAVDYPFDFVDHATLYASSDIVTIHVDGRAENRGMLGAAALSQLRPDVLLINAARGMLVNAAALADWAREVAPEGGRAVLDVHDPEPPAADYPLFGVPNVLLLPHIASRTDRALENMSWVVRDVWSVLDGASPQYPAWT